MPMRKKETEELIRYYERSNEKERLSTVWGELEFARTQDVLQRYLPPPPAVVLDVGGAAGRYSCWLARAGYETHLIDPVARLVAQAEEASRQQPDTPVASCRVGDARNLDFPAGIADAILLLGPLYHLLELPDRKQALLEAMRVLRPGGLLFAAGISRFASAIDGILFGFIHDPAFQKIVHADLETGRHHNPTGNLYYFTEAYFHRPSELLEEIERAGFESRSLVAVEGMAYILPSLPELWKDGNKRKNLLAMLAKLEEEPELIGATPHFLCIAQKPE